MVILKEKGLFYLRNPALCCGIPLGKGQEVHCIEKKLSSRKNPETTAAAGIFHFILNISSLIN